MQNPVNRIRGFAVIDSILALAILCSFLTEWIMFNQTNYNRKFAKKLSTETEVFATTFARYMNNHYTDLLLTARSGSPITLSPSILKAQSSWPIDLANTNLYNQIPCVTILPNQKTGDLEALMYYVWGKKDIAKRMMFSVNEAVINLGNKGGIVLDGVVQGNSGWSVNKDSNFFSGANICGGNLANDSLAVNIDLMNDWNQDTAPSIAITKDPAAVSSDIRAMPGHMLNPNTSKSNIAFLANAGVIIDNSDPNNPVVLKMGYGAGTNEATISLNGANNQNSTTVADTLQMTGEGEAGDSCILEELGKIIKDRGNKKSKAYQYLTRSTLVCSQNKMLCANVNATNTCYLPASANRVNYENDSIGIQDANGQFVCPNATPFAANVITSKGNDTSIILPIQRNIDDYVVTIGYYLTTNTAMIMQVTCSNLPDYSI